MSYAHIRSKSRTQVPPPCPFAVFGPTVGHKACAARIDCVWLLAPLDAADIPTEHQQSAVPDPTATSKPAAGLTSILALEDDWREWNKPSKESPQQGEPRSSTDPAPTEASASERRWQAQEEIYQEQQLAPEHKSHGQQDEADRWIDRLLQEAPAEQNEAVPSISPDVPMAGPPLSFCSSLSSARSWTGTSS